MKITLCAIDARLTEAWQEACGDLDFVEVYRGSILDLRCDAVVSPANSFGFMDGGIDALYTSHFGFPLQQRLQELICQRHHGELLVGAAEIVDTDDQRIPFLIAAPTMRVPTILKDSINPYLAARAALLLVREGFFPSGMLIGERIRDGVKSIAFPGLGTGVGRVAPEICARQVRQAINEVVLGQHTFPTSWLDAQIRHQKMFTDRIRDLQSDS
ncbi:Appr-1-p processing protein [Blastopirellula marina]|uniref:Appr-1-p processing protein n=1 Tax=Blastopirellula marina TaxID=124 RepID=A0A2S8FAR5_9BACT|nr:MULTISPECIES: macro domain-containing protein [Pirellulaceae]PQO29239.1 Appr-1-p processing protein [Blastopirellula marina]RCS50432.1 Appr-1-p processing protein [Bremerella cremea]